MNWMRDWVYSVIKPFLTQLKNRLSNVAIQYNIDGTSDLMTPNGDILPIHKRVGETGFVTGVWTTLVYVESKNLSTSFRLTVSHVHGSIVLPQVFDILMSHNNRVDVVTVHSRVYGTYELRVLADTKGNGYVQLKATSGNDQADKTIRIQVDNFSGSKLVIAPTDTPSDEYTQQYLKDSANAGINSVDNIKMIRRSNGTWDFYDRTGKVMRIGNQAPDGNQGVNLIRPHNQGRRWGGVHTGKVILIRFPFVGPTYTMSNMTFTVYNYTPHAGFKFMCGGYNYTLPKWYNTFGKKLSDVEEQFGKVQMIRLLKTGGDEAVAEDYNHFGMVIGIDEAVWKYPAISLESIQLSHNNINYDRWDNGWLYELIAPADLPPHKVDYVHTL